MLLCLRHTLVGMHVNHLQSKNAIFGYSVILHRISIQMVFFGCEGHQGEFDTEDAVNPYFVFMLN